MIDLLDQYIRTNPLYRKGERVQSWCWIRPPSALRNSGRLPMKNFSELTEQELLALAITLEEEDIRSYSDLAEALRETYPGTARMFTAMSAEEDGHRHRLLDLYRKKFGDHIPMIRRQDVKGFLERKSLWLVRPLGLEKVRAHAELMEAESK